MLSTHAIIMLLLKYMLSINTCYDTCHLLVSTHAITLAINICYHACYQSTPSTHPLNPPHQPLFYLFISSLLVDGLKRRGSTYVREGRKMWEQSVRAAEQLVDLRRAVQVGTFHTPSHPPLIYPPAPFNISSPPFPPPSLNSPLPPPPHTHCHRTRRS